MNISHSHNNYISTRDQPLKKETYCIPLSATADIIASATSVLNANCQQLSYNTMLP